MKNSWIKRTLTAALAAACVMSAVPVTAASVRAEEAAADAAEMPDAGTVSIEETAAPAEDVKAEETLPAEATAASAENMAPAEVQASAETQEPEEEQVPEETQTPEVPEEAQTPEAPEESQTPEAPEEAQTPEETQVPEGSQGPEETQEPEEAEETEPEEELEQAEEEEMPTILYSTHVQTYGWQDRVADGAVAGTTGESKRLEGITIEVSGAEDLHVEYRTHVQTYGWKEYVTDGQISGTTGESKRLEAIQIRLTGADAEKYDVYYCVHAQTYGWLNWAKNDQMAGTAGLSKRLEGIRIVIQKKDEPAPASVSGALCSFLDVEGYGTVGDNSFKVIYNTHVQTYGWQDWVGDGAPAGTNGESKRLEGLHIRLQDPEVSGSIEYRTHVQGIGWQDWVRDGAMAGTIGMSKRLEALQIRLTGEMAEKYDVWYRTHVQKFGWRGWAKNGEQAGSQGYSYRMEAVEIQLLPKGSPAPGSTADAFSVATVRDLYPLASARLDQIGWDLRNAFIWSASMPYYRLPQDISYGARFFATYGFENGRGDCYVMAACFYEMAKALGYDAHWMFGYVPMAAGGLGIHSWVEIDLNGTTYVSDPDYTHETGANGYMNSYGWSGWGYYYSRRMN